GWYMEFYGQAPNTSGASKGLWGSYWSLGNDNSWPGAILAQGGELDVAEFAGFSNCITNYTQYDSATHVTGGASGGSANTGAGGTFTGTDHRFGATYIASGSAVNWYLDGSLAPNNSPASFGPLEPFYPI